MRFAVARQAGLTEDVVDLIDDDFEDSALGLREKVVIRFTDAFLTDPARIPTTLQAQVREVLSPAEVVELALILGAFVGFAKLRIALQLVPGEMTTRVVDTPGAPAAHGPT